MADAALPRLLYLADVQVESSQHGSALIFRALETYPPDRLRIVETAATSLPERRLPGVRYASLPIGRRRWLNTRLHGIYSAWLTWRAAQRADRVVSALSGFEVEAVATVGHGFGWITAAEVAQRLGVPLHLIVHDDWPRSSAIVEPCRPFLERTFGRVYRGAASRLCVSPFMAEEYERRYGAAGSLMYPSRSKECPVFAAKAPRFIGDEDMVIGYGGNSSPLLVESLRQLAATLPGTRTRLALFGGFDEDAKRRLLAESPAITFHGFVPFDEMIRRLREIADVLFVPMTFGAEQMDNMKISFPSKLTDYTATGLPLLIHAPAYSSAVRWARGEDGVAEIVDETGEAPLRAAIARLREDADRRARLAANAVTAGHRYFGSAAARAALTRALLGATP
ncbi:MAG TPA: glycosyltransferase [Vicinamibacterales bacterium]|nr:glycosyltransferase [Vicinamibacterales bacterium]